MAFHSSNIMYFHLRHIWDSSTLVLDSIFDFRNRPADHWHLWNAKGLQFDWEEVSIGIKCCNLRKALCLPVHSVHQALTFEIAWDTQSNHFERFENFELAWHFSSKHLLMQLLQFLSPTVPNTGALVVIIDIGRVSSHPVHLTFSSEAPYSHISHMVS